MACKFEISSWGDEIIKPILEKQSLKNIPGITISRRKEIKEIKNLEILEKKDEYTPKEIFETNESLFNTMHDNFNLACENNESSMNKSSMNESIINNTMHDIFSKKVLAYIIQNNIPEDHSEIWHITIIKNDKWFEILVYPKNNGDLVLNLEFWKGITIKNKLEPTRKVYK